MLLVFNTLAFNTLAFNTSAYRRLELVDTEGRGMIIAEGTPEQVAEVKGLYTGEFLKLMLEQGMKDVS